ncbi:MAG TPA: hypothetical protein HA272_06375 [Methanoregula sp.]|nr:hypothetical protein [Methanoregula sp.]
MNMQPDDSGLQPGKNELPDEDIVYIWSPDPYPVLAGLIIFASLYLFPIFPLPPPSRGHLTLATIVMDGSYGLYSWSPILILTFVLGWGAAIGLVIYGLVNKKPVLDFDRR